MQLASLLSGFSPYRCYTYHSEGGGVRFQKTPRQWALACNAMEAAFNVLHIDLVGGLQKTQSIAAITRMNLKVQWDIVDRESLIKTLDWLARLDKDETLPESEGLSSKLGSVMAVYRKQKNDTATEPAAAELHYADLLPAERANIDKNGFMAWDLVRHINLVQMGYLADWLHVSELDSLLLYPAQFLQARFSGWDELGMNYLLGYSFSCFDEEDRDAMRYEMLDLLKNSRSPWVQIGFKSVKLS